MKKVFAKEDLCINCRLCEVYCKTAHSKSKDIVTAFKQEIPEPVARISVLGGKTASVAVNCRHCEEPACVKACITGAMRKDEKTGIVCVNEEKCIGWQNLSGNLYPQHQDRMQIYIHLTKFLNIENRLLLNFYVEYLFWL